MVKRSWLRRLTGQVSNRRTPGGSGAGALRDRPARPPRGGPLHLELLEDRTLLAVAPGALPNDGKVIADERPVG